MFACAINTTMILCHDSNIWLYRHVGGAVVSKNACFWWPPITAQRPSTQRTFSEQQAAAHHAVVARTRCVMRGVVIISDKLFNDLVLYPLDAPLTYLHRYSMPAPPGSSGLRGKNWQVMAFQITIIIPVSFSHLKFQYHIVFNLVSIHLNLFYILLKSNVATDRFKTQSLFPWNLDNFFLIVAGQIQIECKSTKI